MQSRLGVRERCQFTDRCADGAGAVRDLHAHEAEFDGSSFPKTVGSLTYPIRPQQKCSLLGGPEAHRRALRLRNTNSLLRGCSLRARAREL